MSEPTDQVDVYQFGPAARGSLPRLLENAAALLRENPELFVVDLTVQRRAGGLLLSIYCRRPAQEEEREK